MNAEGGPHRLANRFSFGREKCEYKFGTCFRGKNNANFDQNILEINEDFETDGRRKVVGIISTRVEDILIPGKEMFVEYTTQRINNELESDSYEGDAAIFMGMGIPKGNNEEAQGLSMGAERYEDK